VLVFGLNHTAVPALVDVPLATFAVTGLTLAVLAAGLLRERPPAAGTPRRRWIAGAALVCTAVIAALSAHQRFLSYRAYDARFSSDGVELAGTLYSPS
jgi:hypothetical protein